MDFDDRWYRWRVSYEDVKPFVYVTNSHPHFIGTVAMAHDFAWEMRPKEWP